MPSIIFAAVNGAAAVSGATCTGEAAVASTCSVTVMYDPTLSSPTGLAYDTLDVRVCSDAGQMADWVQRYTIVLTPASTTDGD